MYSWIQSYLFQRSARVRLDGQTSSSVKIREGVPQGGVISPHMEYASSAWSSAAKTNLDQLTKTQNVGLRIITGGMKTTPISELERTAGLLSLGERREEKLLRQREKMKRLPSHPLHSKFEAPTKNRLKRQSPNHLVKALEQKHRIPSSARNQQLEMLQNYEDWQAETPTILDIPGIQAKDHLTDEELRSLTLEALSVAYPSTTWARAYTYAYALLTAAQTLNQEERLHTNTVFLTDCQSILQSLQAPGGDQIFSNIRQELSLLKNKNSLPTAVLEAMKKQTGCQKWEVSWSNLHSPCPTAKQRPS